MTDLHKQPRPMTRQQLRAVAYKIAITYLEIERGLRSPDQLAKFLSPAEYRRHRLTARGARAAARPVRPSDIGRVRIDAATRQRVNASVLVRRGEDHWSALLLDLKQTGQGWQVERLDRLECLVPREPRHVEIDEDAVGRRRRFAENERRVVEAVSTAASGRYERAPDKRVREAKALLDERDRWRARLAELGAEATVLDQRRLRADLLPAGQSLDRDEHCRAQSALETILGPRPDEPPRADVWDRAEQALTTYKDRWKLDSPTALLRAACLVAQESDRRDLLQLLAQAAREMEGTTRSLDPALAVQEQPIVSLE